MPFYIVKGSFGWCNKQYNLNGSLFLKAVGSGQRMSDWLYLEMTDVKQTRTLFINGTDLADSFKKGSFKQSCSHMTTYKAVGSNAKNYPYNKILLIQPRWAERTAEEKRYRRYGGNFAALRNDFAKACFCLLLSQDTKVSARRTGEHTNKSLVQ